MKPKKEKKMPAASNKKKFDRDGKPSPKPVKLPGQKQPVGVKS